MDLKASQAVIKKTAFAAVGAPVVVGRKVKGFSTKVVEEAQAQFDTYATEGEKMAKQLKKRNVVEELEQRISIDKVQDRVERLRDQLETTLSNWRDSFAPAAKPASVKKPAAKAPAKKPAAKTTAKKTPAKKTPVKATATTGK